MNRFHDQQREDIAEAQQGGGGGCQQEPCCAFVDGPESELRHMLEVAHANGFRSITAAITFAKMARPALIQAEAALNRHKDIWDADLDHVHPDIKAERLALRAVQAVLRHNAGQHLTGDRSGPKNTEDVAAG